MFPKRCPSLRQNTSPYDIYCWDQGQYQKQQSIGQVTDLICFLINPSSFLVGVSTTKTGTETLIKDDIFKIEDDIIRLWSDDWKCKEN